jgi:hypothetical protein
MTRRSSWRRAMTIDNDFEVTYRVLVAANLGLGRVEQARRLVERYRAIFPASSASDIRAGHKDENRIELLVAAMEEAGMTWL